MAKAALHPSRTKFLALLKQTTGIELEIATAEEVDENQKVLRESASGDHIYIKNSEFSLLQRAQRREQLVQSRQQNNLEQIYSLALEYINQDAQFDRLDLDWLMKFNDLALQSYSSTMQELWAKILAVELSNVGTFSYRSLKTLSEISTKEAMAFYKAVKLMTRVGDERAGKIITGMYKKPTLMSIFAGNNRQTVNLSKFGLSYTLLMTLSELGLIYGQEIESAAYQVNDTIKVVYQSNTQLLKVEQKDVILTYYKFTQTGYELSKLVSVSEEPLYIAALTQQFANLVSAQSTKAAV